MIEIALASDRAVVAHLDALQEKAHRSLVRAVAQLGFASRRKIQREKLPGRALQDSWLIQARRAKALRFDPSTSSAGGRVLYRRSITPPGLPERSFLRSALAEMAPEIAPKIEAAILAALRS
ncbi:MAG TPA: hypothetical protein VE993_12600 [Stellaceae bacterium]|nr:hypothetical protein [Stellaceae bacterium]